MPPSDPPTSSRIGGKFPAYVRPPAAPADPVVAPAAAQPVASEGGAELTAAVVQPLGPLATEATDAPASAPGAAEMLPLGEVATPAADA